MSLDSITYMIHLLTRLDYNGFYSQYFASHPIVTHKKDKNIVP